jgi:hypothetical protein
MGEDKAKISETEAQIEKLRKENAKLNPYLDSKYQENELAIYKQQVKLNDLEGAHNKLAANRLQLQVQEEKLAVKKYEDELDGEARVRSARWQTLTALKAQGVDVDAAKAKAEEAAKLVEIDNREKEERKKAIDALNDYVATQTRAGIAVNAAEIQAELDGTIAKIRAKFEDERKRIKEAPKPSQPIDNTYEQTADRKEKLRQQIAEEEMRQKHLDLSANLYTIEMKYDELLKNVSDKEERNLLLKKKQLDVQNALNAASKGSWELGNLAGRTRDREHCPICRED